MSFNCSEGNLLRNLYLDRPAREKVDKVEAVIAPDFSGERVQFVHEYGDRFCLHVGDAVQVYARDFSSQKIIGSLPSGPAVLFLPKAIWATHVGPLRKYGPDLKPLVEQYLVPHGGPWTKSLGIFPTAEGISLAYAFSGGPRVWAPELNINLVKETAPDDPSVRPALQEGDPTSRTGYIESIVLMDDRLYAGGEPGLAILKPDGSVRKEVPLKEGIRRLTGCLETRVVGGFASEEERWIYREFDAGGTETLAYTMSGSQVVGYVVFDAQGARYLMSEKRLIKLGPDGQREWSCSLRGEHTESPRFLVYQDGCAFVDAGFLVLIKAKDGTDRLRIPLPGKKVSSPPYLDSQGNFWLGLGDEAENLLKVTLKS